MNKDKKHIDQLFQKGFQDFEIAPPDALWANIAEQLPKKKKKKSRLIVLFPLGIAASLALFFLVINQNTTQIHHPTSVTTNWEDSPCPEVYKEGYASFNKKEGNAFSNTDTLHSNAADAQIAVTNRATIKKLPIIATTNPTHNIAHNTNTFIKTSKKEVIQEKIVANKSAMGSNIIIENRKESILEKELLDISPKKPIPNNPQEIAQGIPLDTLQSIENEQPRKLNKWSIQPQVAALDYNALNGDSTFGDVLEGQDYESKTSYGVKIAFQASPKWSVRAGINTANFNINTTLENSLEFGTVQSFIDGTQNSPTVAARKEVTALTPRRVLAPIQSDVTFDSGVPIIPDSRNGVSSPDAFSRGNLRQEINYIEVPLEASYQLIDKKIGVSVIGGFSTFILTKNQSSVAFQNNQSREFGDQLINVNSTVFSNNLGLGIQYKITEKLKFNLEPTVKVQWNAFNTETNFRPYILGIYSGISLRL